MKALEIKTIPILRRIIQLLAIIFFPSMFTTIFYAIKSVYTAVISGNLIENINYSSVFIVVGVLLITILLGRFFCGFLCSFGAMEDLIWFISKKTIALKVKVPEKIDAVLKLVKYSVLLLIVILFWTLQYQFSDIIVSPWTVFGMYTSLSGWSNPKNLMTIGGLLLLIIIVASFFIERFFCRYLCPLGAIFALLSRFRPFKLRKKREECGACKLCTSKCSMGIALYQMDEVKSGECIQCFQCAKSCPRQNIVANPTPAVVSVASVVAITGMVYLGTLSTEGESSTSIAVSESIKESEHGQYTDGVYTGSAMGFRGETEVSVTVESGKISDITIVSYVDDEQFFANAKDVIVEEILNTQSVEVDTVSGATFSSNGIREAVANALGISFTNPNDSAEKNVHGHGGGGERYGKSSRNVVK